MMFFCDLRFRDYCCATRAMRLTHPLLRPKARPKPAVRPTDSNGLRAELLQHADPAFPHGAYIDLYATARPATQPRPTIRPTDSAGGQDLLKAAPGIVLGVCTDTDQLEFVKCHVDATAALTSSIATPTYRTSVDAAGCRRCSQASGEEDNSGPCSVNARPHKQGILEDVSGKRRQCTSCLLWFLRQDILIEPAQYGDWQGRLSILCYSCDRKEHPWRYCSQRLRDRAKPLSDAAARRQFRRNRRRATLDWKRHAFGDAVILPPRRLHCPRRKTERAAAPLGMIECPVVL